MCTKYLPLLNGRNDAIDISPLFNDPSALLSMTNYFTHHLPSSVHNPHSTALLSFNTFSSSQSELALSLQKALQLPLLPMRLNRSDTSQPTFLTVSEALPPSATSITNVIVCLDWIKSKNSILSVLHSLSQFQHIKVVGIVTLRCDDASLLTNSTVPLLLSVWKPRAGLPLVCLPKLNTVQVDATTTAQKTTTTTTTTASNAINANPTTTATSTSLKRKRNSIDTNVTNTHPPINVSTTPTTNVASVALPFSPSSSLASSSCKFNLLKFISFLFFFITPKNWLM